MAQHDNGLILANQDFPATRADINDIFRDLGTNSSGTSFPSPHYDSMFYADTNNHVLYQRDGANANWSLVRGLDANKVRIVTANTTLTVRDMGKVILCNALSNITITLPTPSALLNGFIVTIKKINDTNTVTIGSNIDGATTIEIEEEHESVDIICDGSAYRRKTAFNVFSSEADYDTGWIGIEDNTTIHSMTDVGFGTTIGYYLIMGRYTASDGNIYIANIAYLSNTGNTGEGITYSMNIQNTNDLRIRVGKVATNFIRAFTPTASNATQNDRQNSGDIRFLVWRG